MNNAIFNIERPVNERAKNYAPGCHERDILNAGLGRLSGEVVLAIEAAQKAHREWKTTSWVERVSISMKIAGLIAVKYRRWINAADKSGSHLNLLRWTNPRTIKETLLPATEFTYPYMKQ